MEEPDRKGATEDAGIMLTAQTEFFLCPGTGGSTFPVISCLIHPATMGARESTPLLQKRKQEFKPLGQAQKATKLYSFKLSLSSYIMGIMEWTDYRGDRVWGERCFSSSETLGKDSWIRIERKMGQLFDPYLSACVVPSVGLHTAPHSSILKEPQAVWRMPVFVGFFFFFLVI